MTAPIWQLKTVSLASGSTTRLAGVTLSIQPGVTAVLGASGAGKSSLLSLLAGFEQPTSGAIEFVPKADAGQLPLFWSPQDNGLWPKLTAREHLATVRPDAPQIDRSVDEWLALLRLSEVADALPHRLSQGERSRLSLGRALASEADCLVLDEPLAHVDPIHCRSYLDLIANHAKSIEGHVVFSTHDPASVLRIAEHVICLSEARCVFSGPGNELYFNPPTEETAWLLGPANWIDEGNVSLRSLFGDTTLRCVRPGELSVFRDETETVSNNGPAVGEVIDKQSDGDIVELTIQDATGRIHQLFSGRCDADIVAGTRVRLRFHPRVERPTASR